MHFKVALLVGVVVILNRGGTAVIFARKMVDNQTQWIIAVCQNVSSADRNNIGQETVHVRITVATIVMIVVHRIFCGNFKYCV